MNQYKIFQGHAQRSALREQVPNWYKSFPSDHFGQAEMKDSTMLNNKISTASSCAENQILGLLILRIIFKYLYWMMNQIISWNLDTRKVTYIIDCVGRVDFPLRKWTNEDLQPQISRYSVWHMDAHNLKSTPPRVVVTGMMMLRVSNSLEQVDLLVWF
jgi:hypothetical protein